MVLGLALVVGLANLSYLGWVIVLGNASVGSLLFWLSVWWVMGLATGLAVHLVLGLGLAILFAAFVLVPVKSNSLAFSSVLDYCFWLAMVLEICLGLALVLGPGLAILGVSLALGLVFWLVLGVWVWVWGWSA